MKTSKRILVLLLVVCVLAGAVSATTFATSGEDYIETGQAESENASEEAATEPEPDNAESEDFTEEGSHGQW